MRRLREATPAERTADIEKARHLVNRGAQVATLEQDIEPILKRLDAIFHDQFVQNTKIAGELDKHSGYMMVAVAELRLMLSEEIERGRRASQKLDKLNTGGGTSG